MLKVLFAIVVSLASVACVTAAVATCSMSGDPHFVTFDGVYHDFQGAGIWQAAKNSIINVQYETVPCNPPHVVTCVYRVAVQIFGETSDVVQYGHNIGGVFKINGANYSANARTGVVVTPNGLASVSFASNQVSIVGKAGWSVTIGPYLLVIALPFTNDYMSVTYGTCGFFDGVASNDFTATNGTLYVPNTVKGTRYNSAAVNAWGSTFGISTNGRTPPLFNLFHRYNLATKSYELLDTIPDPVVPTDSEQVELDKVPFSNIDAFNQAQATCKAQITVDDAKIIENCVYDFAVLGDATLAASNSQAAEVQQNSNAKKSSGSGLGAGATAGIVLGVIAAVSLITSFLLYVRLRKVRSELSRALIVRSQPSDPNMQSGVALGI